ncbi:MAG: hypothetical protein Fur005_46910 [Roseiflexaceae bacterium]
MKLGRSIPLLCAILLAITAWATPAQATPTYGYLWLLNFDFEQSYDGLLTIQVGPWEDGDLISVDAVSTTRVPCRPIGAVALNGGDAVFSGGYIQCSMNLARIVAERHGLTVAAQDSYGSIILQTELDTTTPHVATIFSHPDASYRLDLTQTASVGMTQSLNNAAGVQNQQFFGIIPANRHLYTYMYGCVWMGPCHGTFVAAGSGEHTPNAGTRIAWTTGFTTFQIGGGKGDSFRGRMGSLLIDPGNSVH